MNEMKSIQDRYFEWLSTKASAAQISELYLMYPEIERFCMERKVLREKLFETVSPVVIQKVVETVESNKVFRFMHKRNMSNPD